VEHQLVYKGVVFNEMKGAISSPVATLWQKLSGHLFPTTTYHHNSGGDPEAIPDLTWEQLKAFHSRHYHPSNAVFFTYGDIPAVTHQQEFEQRALSKFEHLDVDFSVPDEQRYSTPQAVTESYALDPQEDQQRKAHLVVGWLLGPMIDIQASLRAHLLTQVLLDNSASPLRLALETSDLGAAPSPLCGLDDSSKEMVFVCGLEGCEAEDAEAIETLIIETLTRVAEQGVPQEQIEAMLHQLELSRKEVGGDRFPYGLQLVFNALPAAIHNGDAVAALALDGAIAALREEITDRQFIPALIRQLLLDNPHRVRLSMVPDSQLAEAREQQETDRLAQLQAGLSPDDRDKIVELTQALAQRQAEEDDAELLPKVGLDDVAPELAIPQGFEEPVCGMPASWYDRPTNGLVYQQIIIDLPALTEPELDLLPLLAACLPEVGSGDRDYLQTQMMQAAVTGGIRSSTRVSNLVGSIQSARGIFVVSGKSLVRNQGALTRLLQETLDSARFDETERIRELVAQIRVAEENSITGAGHSLAMLAASAGIGPSAAIAHRWSGLEGIRQTRALDQAVDDSAALASLCDQLQALLARLAQAPRQLLLISEEEYQSEIAVKLVEAWQGKATPDPQPGLELTAVDARIQQAWTTNTQINFCARAYSTVPASHADSPALSVLGGVLRNNYLHTAIREKGGAYGGGASYDSDSGAFRFFSYRDPRLADTLIDFDRSVEWLLTERHSPRLLEEAVLGVISRIDQPGSPAGEAKQAFFANLFGQSAEFRRQYRQRVLSVTQEDLRRVASTWLLPDRASTAVVTNGQNLEKSGLDLEVCSL
ncbi:MAG: insulinase family protein, partial [Gammaproteobacteria bacterium]